MCDDINQTDGVKIYRDKFRLPINDRGIQMFQRIYEKQIGLFEKNELDEQDITSFKWMKFYNVDGLCQAIDDLDLGLKGILAKCNNVGGLEDMQL